MVGIFVYTQSPFLRENNVLMGFPGSSVGKESACNAEDMGSIPELGRSPGEGMATHSSILAWRTPWIEELDGL